MDRDGSVQAARFCAGCHDLVPFFSGAFDDPDFDDVNHPTAQAGITCTGCHAITNVNSIDELRIYWPDGEIQTLADVPVDQELAVSRR
jgi:hypothetical protein